MSGTSIFTRKKEWKRRDPALPPTPQKKWAEANREKLKAHALVRQAVRKGWLKRGKCACGCGSLRVEAHHPDYSQPLKVVWLARKCHQRLHAEERKAAH